MNKKKIIFSVVLLVIALACVVSGFIIAKITTTSTSITKVETAVSTTKQVWTCSMHPTVKLPKAGSCPICAMDLIPLKKGKDLGPRQIEMSPNAIKMAEIQTTPVIRKNAAMSISLVGKLNFDESRIKDITARFGARLDRLYVDYTGVPVSKGDHLVSAYSPELVNAQEELLQALETLKALDKSNIDVVTESSRLAIQASRDKLLLWGLSQQQVDTIEKSGKTTDHITQYSPIAGIVIKKHLNEGAYVKEGSPIYTIADMTHLWLELDAYESNLQWLRYAQKVSFETEAYPGETFNGQISFIHPVLNAKTRTVKIRVNVNNKNGRLKPQMFVRARIQTFINQQGLVIDNSLKGKLLCPMHPEIIDTVQKPCSICGMKLVPSEKLGLVSSNKGQAPLLIPVSAPLITGKRAVVYVRVKEGLFEGRLITLGPRVEGYYIVNKGLKEGDLVVTNGAFKIDSSLQILAKPSMMSSSKEEINKFTLPVESLQKLQPLFDAYFAIGTSLSKNSSSEIKTQSGKLMTALTLVDFNDSKNELLLAWQDMSRKIELKAKLLGNSKELEETRLNFEKLSKIMTLLVKQFGSPQTVHQAYCPMAFDDAGAFWLQTDKKITNPYYGSSMLGCGAIKKTFPVEAQK